MSAVELSAKTLGCENWIWIFSILLFDEVTVVARLILLLSEKHFYRDSLWELTVSKSDYSFEDYCACSMGIGEVNFILLLLVLCLPSRFYTSFLIVYVSFFEITVFYHLNPSVFELFRLADKIYIFFKWSLFIHLLIIPITIIKYGFVIWILWRMIEAEPAHFGGRMGIRNGILMAIICVSHSVIGIVIAIAHSRSGIGGIEVSLWTLKGIASLNYLVLFHASFLSIFFIIWVFTFPSLRKDSNTYLVSAVSTIIVGLILLSPIVLEYQEFLNFYKSYKELFIVQYVCASIFLVCGMFLTMILWKVRWVKVKIMKPKKKKKPKKIQYKVIYGGEESSTKKMITADCE